MSKQVFFIFILLFSFTNIAANDNPKWGSTGHRAIGVIAEKHLTKKARSIEPMKRIKQDSQKLIK